MAIPPGLPLTAGPEDLAKDEGEPRQSAS